MRTLPALAALAVLTAPLAARGECHNTFFTNKPGAVWKYRAGQGSEQRETEMTLVKMEGSKMVLHMKMTQPGGQKASDSPGMDLEGECTSDGIRIALGLGAAGPHSKVSHEEGVDYPPSDKLKVGYSWSSSRTTEMGEGKGMQMTMTSKTKHTVVAQEKVTVPAGAYETFKIVGESEITMSMGGAMADKMPAQPPQKATNTMWVARGVGIVRTENEAPDMKGGTRKIVSELASYTPGE